MRKRKLGAGSNPITGAWAKVMYRLTLKSSRVQFDLHVGLLPTFDPSELEEALHRSSSLG